MNTLVNIIRLSQTFVNFQVFPNSEIKLLSLLSLKGETNNFKEVELKEEDEIYILKNGIYPIYKAFNSKYNKLYIDFKGRIHRANDLPAIEKEEDIQDLDEFVLVEEKYYKKGKFHRDTDRPARFVQEFNDVDDKFYILEEYYKEGILHRDNGPAKVRKERNELESNSHIILEEYYKEGILHRDNGPARIEYEYIEYSSVVKLEEYYKEGILHRDNDPARIEFFLHDEDNDDFLNSDRIILEEYYKEGRFFFRYTYYICPKCNHSRLSHKEYFLEEKLNIKYEDDESCRNCQQDSD